ncbi:hypothetical protein P389DRAFT_211577 [Cystobasidium minutum MCA 4210]|uniref:uncharacterized protein n=1 Tax=Cystobasidium minutum MCA 4210 TaxID=1397322 RepID=UPI0034CD565A|eukprot:jgi/Rhomi1/211577/estExt_Genemark1.C_5_t10103
MEWWGFLLISIGGVLAVAAISLHAFEYFYKRKLAKDSQLGICNFTFNLGSSVNLSEDASRSPGYATHSQESYTSTPASPASMTFSDSSSPSSTSLEFSRSNVSDLPRKPKTVHVRPQKTFISFDHLRSTSYEDDLEAQDKAVGGTMKGLGW